MIGNGGDIIDPLNGNLELRCDRVPTYAQPMCTYSLSSEQSSLSSPQTNLQPLPPCIISHCATQSMHLSTQQQHNVQPTQTTASQSYMHPIIYPTISPAFSLPNELYDYSCSVSQQPSTAESAVLPDLVHLQYKSTVTENPSLHSPQHYIGHIGNQVPSQSQPQSTATSNHATATASDPCTQIAHVLQCYQQGGEDAEFVRKAIESLVKKLKDKRVELENLISAVTSGGKQPTSCVTIQRSLDGRLQVAGRKGVPHVVYARIWRWPNVNKNELQKLPICTVSSDNQDVICINPYHYERIVSSSIGSIDMSSFRLDTLKSSSQANSMQVTVENATSTPHVNGQSTHIINKQQHSSSTGLLSNNSEGVQNSWNMSSCSVTSPQLYNSDGFACSSFHIGSAAKFDLNAVQLPTIGPLEHWCSITYYEFDTQVGETFKVRVNQPEVFVDGGVNPSATQEGRFCLGALPNVHRDAPSEKTRLHIGKGVKISTQRDGSVYLECLSHQSVYVRSYYLDYAHNSEYGMIVYKFCSGAPIRKIFDLRWAYAEMEQQSNSARLAVAAQAAAVAGIVSPAALTPSLIEHAGTGVDDLRKVCCTIGISFVKGWGPGYKRTSIKETPCWIEIQLHRPLQLLDQLLKKNNDYYSCE